MSTALAVSIHHVRRALWKRPDVSPLAVALLAWALMLSGAVTHVSHHPTESSMHALSAAVSHSLVMAIAMMTPLVLPQVRHVAVASLWRRRYIAAFEFWIAYVAVWAVVATGILLAAAVAIEHAGRTVSVAIAASLATYAYLSPRRSRRLRACTMTRPLAPEGLRADWDCLAYGHAVAVRCVATCWAPMAVAVVSPGLLSMAVVTVLQYTERARHRSTRRQRAHLVAATVAIALSALWF